MKAHKSHKIHWWLSNQKMIVRVAIQDGKIVDASPIVRKFIGQPFQNVVGWMYRMARKVNPNLDTLSGMRWEWLAIESAYSPEIIYNERFYANHNNRKSV